MLYIVVNCILFIKDLWIEKWGCFVCLVENNYYLFVEISLMVRFE